MAQQKPQTQQEGKAKDQLAIYGQAKQTRLGRTPDTSAVSLRLTVTPGFLSEILILTQALYTMGQLFCSETSKKVKCQM